MKSDDERGPVTIGPDEAIHFGTPPKTERNHRLTEERLEGDTLAELGDRHGIDPSRVARLIRRRALQEEDYRLRLEAVGLWPAKRGRRRKEERTE